MIREGDCFIRFCLYSTGSESLFFIQALSNQLSRKSSVEIHFNFSSIFFFTRKSSLVFNSSIQIVLWKLFIHNMNFLNFLIQNKIIASFQLFKMRNGRYISVQMTSYFCRKWPMKFLLSKYWLKNNLVHKSFPAGGFFLDCSVDWNIGCEQTTY